MEKQKALLTHKIRSISDKIYDLVQDQKQLQNELDSLDITLVDSDINNWSPEKKKYFELAGKLNEPERSEALSNFDERYFKNRLKKDSLNIDNINLFQIIDLGFYWDDSEQGKLYWENFAWELESNTYQFDKI